MMRRAGFAMVASGLCLHAAGVTTWAEVPAFSGWRVAQPGYLFRFPRDHYSHPEYKTEWWYVTGNLSAANGRKFGYQVTFFRQGLVPSAERRETRSRFIVPSLRFAHFAVSDLKSGKFHFEQRANRGAFGESGFATWEDTTEGGDPEISLAWIEPWRFDLLPDGAFRLRIPSKKMALDVTLRPLKKPVFHGEGGLSRKSAQPGNASHYYSVTRLESAGTLRIRDKKFRVRGESWFDREWGSSQLAPDKIGWDWFALQLSNETELMIYRIRSRDGRSSDSLSGTFVRRDGTYRTLKAADIRLEPLRRWTIAGGGVSYPVAWRVRIPPLGLELRVSGAMDNQELVLDPVAYWEGAVDVIGEIGESRVSGCGYLEMTGYRRPVTGLR